TRDAPFASPVLASQKITGRHSTKDVRHVELSLEGSGLVYEPGDAIGVWPENPLELVTAVLEAAHLDRDAAVAVGAQTLPLGEALTRRLELTQLGRATLLAYAEVAGAKELTELVADPARLSGYLATRQVLDLLLEFPARLEAQRFAELLRKLTPRLYSAASSPAANPDEVHLTVGVVRYERFGRVHGGAASAFLAVAEDRVPIYVEPNAHFRLPADGATRVIMIGAGTGVAPFRAFLQHRVANGARGENWLFFGDRTLRDDFLYQVEWQRYAHDGALTRLDVAFSRDQQAKVYVQQRLRERAADVYDWLEQGAHLYVCGDAEQLAPDVHAALRDVVRSVGGRSADAAEEYLQRLKAAKRYQRDVY
ncbi:MAG TPA: sulfite reductase [NADPH] flavoprotein alpha-component, partial [Gammaproteobacteria bacterium]|nr:sulfite reductase [NADPH] flavoprotein alpha-component [Gammaproteobacteria bacterium]